MRRLAKKLCAWLGNVHKQPVRRKPMFTRRLLLEALEERFAPATAGFSSTAPGVLTGIVFIDNNNNGVHDAGEQGVQGVSITLNGTPTGSSTPISASTTTDANGQFTFFQVQPGTYSVTRGVLPNLIDGQTTAGNLGGTASTDTISNIAIGPGQVDNALDFGILGLAPAVVSLRQFLSNSSNEIPGSGPAGSGNSSADHSVQPSDSGATGTGSLAGTVNGPSGALSGVEVALSGIDINGRAIVQTTTTAADGSYSFQNLLGGTYTLNLVGAPAGLTANTPTVGGEGGVVLANTQIGNIQLGSGAAIATATNNGASESGTTVTINTTSDHDLVAGDQVTVSGVGVAGYNGTFTITAVPTLTSFQYTAAAGLGVSGGGTVVAAGTGYNFTLVANTQATAGGANLSIAAGLADDSGTPGDGITNDPTMQGSISSSSQVTGFTAQITDLASPPPAVNVLGQLNNGSFVLNQALITQINGGTALADGAHTLHLVVTNSGGSTTSVDVKFTLKTTAPSVPTLVMDSTSDPTSSGTTKATSVTLLGATSPGVLVTLIQGGTKQTTSSDATTGAFSFNVLLTPGVNNFTVQATDNAGNVSQFSTFFIQEQANALQAVPTTNVSESLLSGSTTAQSVDLTDPTLFSDANLTNTEEVTFNTIDGPINVQLFGSDNVNAGGAAQSVANFFNYINSGAYNNDIFHRNQINVLQGGGFTLTTSGSSSNIVAVTTNPTIPIDFNPNNPNTLGTLGEARQTGTNSGSSQWFFNYGNNSTSFNAGNPFSVFGEVMDGPSMRVLQTLAAIPTTNESSNTTVGSGIAGALGNLPLQNYTGTNFPTDTTSSNYAFIKSVTVVQQSDTLTYSITANSDTTQSIVKASIVNDQLELTPVAAGTATITVQAKDRAGSTASVTFNVTVGPVNIALNQGPGSTVTPVIPGMQIVADNQSVNLALTSTPSTGVTWSASNLPPGLSINTSTGAITGVVASNADTGSPYVSTITATNGTNSTSQTIGWSVISNVITFNGTTANQTNVDNDQVNLTVAASDVTPGSTLTYSATGLPTGLSINSSTGQISGQIAVTADTGSPYTTVVTATDGQFSASQSFTWTVSNPLTFTSTNPGAQSSTDAQTPSSLTFVAKNGSATVTYSAKNLPTGLSINSSTGVVSGQIGASADANSPYSTVITATDGTFSTSQAFQWVVANPISLTNPGPQTNTTGDMLTTTPLQIVASGPSGLSYAATGLPPGLTIDPATGKITGTVLAGDHSNSPYAVKVTVSATINTLLVSNSVSFQWTIN